MPALGKSSKNAPGKIRSAIGKVRKKWMPTFGEQFSKAKSEGKSKFKSRRDVTKKGNLEYSTMKKEEVEKKIAKSKVADKKAKEGKGGGADSGSQKKAVYEKATGTKVSDFGQAFSKARKAGKKEFTWKGKKYHTRVKGEEKKKPTIDWKKKKVNIKLPEMSGSTSKKIKKRIGAQGGGRIADAARRAQIHGWYSPDMGMRGRNPRMGMRGGDPRMARGRGYAKGGLIKGKPKLALRGW